MGRADRDPHLASAVRGIRSGVPTPPWVRGPAPRRSAGRSPAVRLAALLSIFTLLLIAACAPPNLGSNVRGGDLERAREVRVASETEGVHDAADLWHVQTDRGSVAEFARVLSTALREADGVDLAPRGPTGRRIVLVLEGGGEYRLTHHPPRLHDPQTDTWYREPEGLAELIERWRRLPATRR